MPYTTLLKVVEINTKLLKIIVFLQNWLQFFLLQLRPDECFKLRKSICQKLINLCLWCAVAQPRELKGFQPPFGQVNENYLTPGRKRLNMFWTSCLSRGGTEGTGQFHSFI